MWYNVIRMIVLEYSEDKHMPKVTLLSYTPNPEKTVAAAAKLCYSRVGVDDLLAGLTDEKAENFVQMLSDIGHESPIEHASFTFGIEGVSRAFLAQITRHRIASYSVQSQRYVNKALFEYVIPPEIEADEQAKSLFLNAMSETAEYYDKLSAILKEKHTAAFIAEGKPQAEAEKLAAKKAIEDARYVLPNACDTKMVVTMNARSLLNFFRERCCNRAQWEIRIVAEQMLALVYEVAPTLFAKAGPPCLRGACPEGKMSCAKQTEVRAHYAGLKGKGK
ncbi:thymidylate synthase (FAD) [Hydrogenoanaerobacterium saccharovorans]|uniref:Flavin-dependent thymidylate synthase n=2 Tax=Hydrogenoanaerobacterium saccharovorans TaxID=474960 RepID=A0A1H7YJ60_9FIRM|nr:thymidylate synthase (FAD) [Hydrogenoanaerobacterium saccharovorans]SEM46292.1 thymidylate synthase (FAD) [Hydrogenoanaerobacterium saccharovorans]